MMRTKVKSRRRTLTQHALCACGAGDRLARRPRRRWISRLASQELVRCVWSIASEGTHSTVPLVPLVPLASLASLASLACLVVGTTTESERSPQQRNGSNPHLKELYVSLSGAYQHSELDAFGLYLYAVVLKRLGYRTSAGRSDAPPHSVASTPTRHPPDALEEEEKREQQQQQQQKRRSVDGFASIAAIAHTNDVTTRVILVESIRQYPWNWSAWMELAALSPFTSSVRVL